MMLEDTYVYNTDRLEALRRSGFWDTHEDFGPLAMKAAMLLGADICQINAVQDVMQKTVAVYPFKEYADLAVKDSGCRVPVETREPFAVSEASKHPLTCTFVWVNEYPGYLGSPIFYEGEVLGSICLLYKVQKTWTIEEVETLNAVAAEISAALKAAQDKE